jgi:hypothetical protein
MTPHPQNPDRVTPPVAVGALAGLIIAAVAKAWLDVELNPADAETWWNVTTGLAVPLLPALGGLIGARFKARNDVTPVRPGDTPRNQAGVRLEPASRVPETGYPPTRAAHPGERKRPPPFGAP